MGTPLTNGQRPGYNPHRLVRRRKWDEGECNLARLGAFLVLGGKSIYSTVKMLRADTRLRARTESSIRSKIDKYRKEQVA